MHKYEHATLLNKSREVIRECSMIAHLRWYSPASRDISAYDASFPSAASFRGPAITRHINRQRRRGQVLYRLTDESESSIIF